jgi:hypothetical protein
MRILSVIPSATDQYTSINTVQDGHFIEFVYSDVYELMHDPFKPGEWLAWNGGTLTEAIQFVINLYYPELRPVDC